MNGCDGDSVSFGPRSGPRASPGGCLGAALPRVRGPLDQADRGPFYPNWDGAARTTAEILRAAAGRDPNDRELSDLVGELATKSEVFRTHWAVHNVRFHATAIKLFNHPGVGELSLSFNRMDIAADHGLTLFTYAAEPGSRSEEALNLLGSWAATTDLAEPQQAVDRG